MVKAEVKNKESYICATTYATLGVSIQAYACLQGETCDYDLAKHPGVRPESV